MKEITFANQRGVVLIVGLIMVLLMSIIAMAAIRGSGMQELMAGNMRDRNLAFQIAEAALRQVEDDAENFPSAVFNDDASDGFVRALTGSGRSSFWDTYNWNSVPTVAGIDVDHIAAAPRFIVEEVVFSIVGGEEGATGGSVGFGETDEYDGYVYRITTRAVGGTEGSVVILQSTYRP
jgi:type IV pilus assembly protein PilX